MTEVLTLAFNRDPVWGWAFPDEERRASQHRVFWRLFVDGAMDHDWIRMTADGGAVALWLPPGCPEMPEEAEARVPAVLSELLGDAQAEVVLEVFERFAAARPADPHYYLSLLGTRPDHRGKGLGMGLVAANLAAIDAAGMPAYLESTNPANVDRYRRVGFEPVGEFALPLDGPSVTTMWRDPQN